MREIKFRAFADSEMTRSFVLKDDYKAIGYYAARGFPIMQFTGLHDKDGKEIYEGDILRFDSAPGMVSGKALVVWHNDQGSWFIENDQEDVWDTIYNITGYCEVIGNIHDNPELLVAHDGK